MLNGSTLKICFLMIVFTLNAVVLFMVIGVIFFHFPVEESKIILGMLGISALFGGITQAFIHANIIEAGKKDTVSTTTTVPSPESLKVPPGPPVVVSLVLLCLMLFSGSAQAKTTVINNTTIVQPTAVVVTEKNVFGPMVSAPHLVRIYGDWYLGAEGYKDEAYTNPSRGWAGFATVTYEGTLLDFTKKKTEDVD